MVFHGNRAHNLYYLPSPGNGQADGGKARAQHWYPVKMRLFVKAPSIRIKMKRKALTPLEAILFQSVTVPMARLN